MMGTVFETEENCSGCGACKSVCAVGAITMKIDENGFCYPEIDNKLCVGCMKCREVCHFNHEELFQNTSEKVFAFQSSNDEILKTSQSGGAFAELALKMLGLGGRVYGAALNDEYSVRHIGIDSQGQLCRLQGSKYVQSSTENIFDAVKTDLENNIKVLFSGTPCQVAALYSYLGEKPELLYTVDIVCHGVMPPAMWRDYTEYINKKYGEIKYAAFREKSFGWKVHDELFVAGGRRIRKNVYRKIFYNDIFLRPCCCRREGNMLITACRYSGMSRVSDMTIGDFWGIEQAEKDFKRPDEGISLCIVNNSRGNRMWETIKPHNLWVKKKAAEAIDRQPHLSGKGKAVPEARAKRARKEYRERGFLCVAAKYGENGIRGIFPKGIRFIKHLKNKVLKRMGVTPDRMRSNDK